MTKLCRGCNEVKLLEDFHRSPVSSDGRAARCKSCRNAEARIYRERRKTAERDAERQGRKKSMTPEERRQRIRELVERHHLTLAEADFTVALEEGEVDGDVVALDADGKPVRAPLT